MHGDVFLVFFFFFCYFKLQFVVNSFHLHTCIVHIETIVFVISTYTFCFHLVCQHSCGTNSFPIIFDDFVFA